MLEHSCKVCNYKITGINTTSLSKLLRKHLKEMHNIQPLEYRTFYLDNLNNLKLCRYEGCSHTVDLKKGIFSDFYCYCKEHRKLAQSHNFARLHKENEVIINNRKIAGRNFKKFNSTPFLERDKDYQVKFRQVRSFHMSKQNKEWWSDPEYRRKKLKQNSDRWKDSEFYKKVSKSFSDRFLNLKYKAKISFNYFKGKELQPELYIMITNDAYKIGLSSNVANRKAQLFSKDEYVKTFIISTNLELEVLCRLEAVLLHKTRKYLKPYKTGNKEFRALNSLDKVFSILHYLNLNIKEL